MNVATVIIAVASVAGALAGDAAPKGPEVWLEFMGGNVRKDGLTCDLEAIKGAGFSGVHFFHIQRGGAWPECPEQIPCMSEKWEDVVRFRDADSDWRDVCVLAFPKPESIGDRT